MTTADFAKYKAIVIPDCLCNTSLSTIQFLDDTKRVWSPAVTGNMVLIGTDPSFHAKWFDLPGAYAMMQDALSLVSMGKNGTGMYFSLSCYYQSNAAPMPIEALSEIGNFQVRGNLSHPCLNNAHLVAKSSVMTSLNDDIASNWNCSVHEVFSEYPRSGPGGFEALAIALNATGIGARSFADNTSGIPYIIARGATPLGCGNNITETEYNEECDDGAANGTPGDLCSSSCKCLHGMIAPGICRSNITSSSSSPTQSSTRFTNSSIAATTSSIASSSATHSFMTVTASPSSPSGGFASPSSNLTYNPPTFSSQEPITITVFPPLPTGSSATTLAAGPISNSSTAFLSNATSPSDSGQSPLPPITVTVQPPRPSSLSPGTFTIGPSDPSASPSVTEIIGSSSPAGLPPGTVTVLPPSLTGTSPGATTVEPSQPIGSPSTSQPGTDPGTVVITASSQPNAQPQPGTVTIDPSGEPGGSPASGGTAILASSPGGSGATVTAQPSSQSRSGSGTQPGHPLVTVTAEPSGQPTASSESQGSPATNQPSDPLNGQPGTPAGTPPQATVTAQPSHRSGFLSGQPVTLSGSRTTEPPSQSETVSESQSSVPPRTVTVLPPNQPGPPNTVVTSGQLGTATNGIPSQSGRPDTSPGSLLSQSPSQAPTSDSFAGTSGSPETLSSPRGTEGASSAISTALSPGGGLTTTTKLASSEPSGPYLFSGTSRTLPGSVTIRPPSNPSNEVSLHSPPGSSTVLPTAGNGRQSSVLPNSPSGLASGTARGTSSDSGLSSGQSSVLATLASSPPSRLSSVPASGPGLGQSSAPSRPLPSDLPLYRSIRPTAPPSGASSRRQTGTKTGNAASTAAFGTSLPPVPSHCDVWIGIEVIYMVEITEVCPEGSTITETITECVATLTRSICQTSATNYPCYPCIMGTPASTDHTATVTVTSCSTSTEPTVTVTVQLCSTCTTTTYIGTVPGYTPGAPCHGCSPYDPSSTMSIPPPIAPASTASPIPSHRTPTSDPERSTTPTGSPGSDPAPGGDPTSKATPTLAPPGNPGLPAPVPSSPVPVPVPAPGYTDRPRPDGSSAPGANHTPYQPSVAPPAPIVTAGGSMTSAGYVGVEALVCVLLVWWV